MENIENDGICWRHIEYITMAKQNQQTPDQENSAPSAGTASPQANGSQQTKCPSLEQYLLNPGTSNDLITDAMANLLFGNASSMPMCMKPLVAELAQRNVAAVILLEQRSRSEHKGGGLVTVCKNWFAWLTNMRKRSLVKAVCKELYDLASAINKNSTDWESALERLRDLQRSFNIRGTSNKDLSVSLFNENGGYKDGVASILTGDFKSFLLEVRTDLDNIDVTGSSGMYKTPSNRYVVFSDYIIQTTAEEKQYKLKYDRNTNKLIGAESKSATSTIVSDIYKPVANYKRVSNNMLTSEQEYSIYITSNATSILENVVKIASKLRKNPKIFNTADSD